MYTKVTPPQLYACSPESGVLTSLTHCVILCLSATIALVIEDCVVIRG